MRNTLMLCCFLFSAAALFAQAVQPVANISLTGNGRAILIHDFSGIPIIQTAETFTGVNPLSYEKMWEVSRSKGAATGEALGGESGTDFTDLYGTPFAYLGGSVVNVLTGKVIVDGVAEDIKRFSAFYIVPDADLMLLELEAKGKVKLFGVDPFTSTPKWSVELREVSGLGQAIGGATGESEAKPYVIPPLLTAAGDLLYHNDKYLASVDLKKGSLRWNNKLNPGYIFLNDDATKILVAEKRGGLGGMMTMPTNGSAPNSFDKTLYLLDANTGESLWTKGDTKMAGNIQFIMPYDGGFAVVHDEGFNIYDYTPGKEAVGRWKKDYSEKGISDIVVQDDGLMLYFKNRRMLIDPKTGENVWKKDEKLERAAPTYTVAPRSNTVTSGSSSFYVQGGNLYLKAGSNSMSFRCERFAMDEANNRLIITRVNDPEATYVGGVMYDIIAIDLASGAAKYGSFTLRKGVQGVDVVGNDNYFIYNDRSFALMKFQSGSWNQVAEKYYPDPARGERFLKGAALGLASAAASTGAALNAGADVVSNNPNAASNYQARMDAINAGDEVASQMNQRKIVGRVEADYGYFFSKNDDGDLVLFKVEKASGKEVKQYPFDDKEPTYEVDAANNLLYYVTDNVLKIFTL